MLTWFNDLLVVRPFDLRSLLSSSNNSIPYLYFILLSSTTLSVGVSYARLLTQGKNPVIKRILSINFLKVIIMLILKFIVQSYFLSMAVKSFMFKFVSKVKSSKFIWIYIFTKYIYNWNCQAQGQGQGQRQRQKSNVKTRPWGRVCNGLAHHPPTTTKLFWA